MNKKLLSLACALMFTTMTVAQDAPQKKDKKTNAGRNNPAMNVVKQLEAAGLTDEQKAKIQTMAKKGYAEMRTVREEAGITPELTKKRAAAMKELKENNSEMKPAELFAAVNKQLGLTDAQVAALKKAQASRTELLKSAIALLSDEQKAKLPKRLVKTASTDGKAAAAGPRKGKGKKKKSDDQ